MSKIIFLDIDGTLVDYENRLPDSAVTAIRRARANGHRVYLCTGRSRAEIYPNLWDIGVDGLIGGNGSYVEDHNTVVMHQLITSEQCRRIVDWLHERKLEFFLESNNGLFASEQFEIQGQPVIQQYAKRKGKNKADQITVRDVFPDMIFGGELYRDDLNKVSYILNSYQDFLDAKEAFPDLQHGTWGGKDEEAYHKKDSFCSYNAKSSAARDIRPVSNSRASPILYWMLSIVGPVDKPVFHKSVI
ncbi:MAG: HAD-IIB family hydrolase [Butyricicoccus sp.]